MSPAEAHASDLAGTTLVVTGGSRGIGEAIVLGALARGARVAFSARALGAESDAVLRTAAARGQAGRVLAVAGDAATEAGVAALFDAAGERFGPVDAAIHNAGVHRSSLLASLAQADWRDMLDLNLTGAFLVSRRALRDWLATGRPGRLVFLGSLMQAGAASDVGYATAKAGLRGLTAAIAGRHGSQGIAANLVVAGFVATRMTAQLPAAQVRSLRSATPLARVAEAHEVAAAALYLASPTAGANGQELFVAGGLHHVPPL